MPINFDEIREKEDRAFIIRGETFTFQHVRPETMDEVDKLENEYIALKEPKYSDLVKMAEDRLILLIDDGNGQVEKWRELRAQTADPIDYGEIMAISRHGLEVISGIPTLPSTNSGVGDGKTAASSKAG